MDLSGPGWSQKPGIPWESLAQVLVLSCTGTLAGNWIKSEEWFSAKCQQPNPVLLTLVPVTKLKSEILESSGIRYFLDLPTIMELLAVSPDVAESQSLSHSNIPHRKIRRNVFWYLKVSHYISFIWSILQTYKNVSSQYKQVLYPVITWTGELRWGKSRLWLLVAVSGLGASYLALNVFHFCCKVEATIEDAGWSEYKIQMG